MGTGVGCEDGVGDEPRWRSGCSGSGAEWSRSLEGAGGLGPASKSSLVTAEKQRWRKQQWAGQGREGKSRLRGGGPQCWVQGRHE